jgi:hypothetical protein
MKRIAAIGKRMQGLTRREKALVIITGVALAWFALAAAIKPAIEVYAQRNNSITLLELQIARIGVAVAGLPGLEKKLEAERGANALLRERYLKLSEKLKSSDSEHGGGLDFLQSIVNGANLRVAEINISSEPVAATGAGMAEQYASAPVKAVRVDNEPPVVRSRIVLKVETGFRELTALVNRIQSTHLPLAVRRLDVTVDTPGHPRMLKMEIEMDVFSL